jgi:hypothetical protein
MPTVQNSKSQTGLGAVLSIGGVAGGTDTWVPVAELDKMPAELMPKWKTTPTTHFQSTMESVGKAIPGTTELTFEGNRVTSDAGMIALRAAYAAPQAYDFKIVLPINLADGQATTGDTLSFTAKVLEIKADAQPDQTIKISTTVVLDSMPILVVGS